MAIAFDKGKPLGKKGKGKPLLAAIRQVNGFWENMARCARIPGKCLREKPPLQGKAPLHTQRGSKGN